MSLHAAELTPPEREAFRRAMAEQGLDSGLAADGEPEVRFLVVDVLDDLAVAWSVLRAAGGGWTEVELVLDVAPGRAERLLSVDSGPWDEGEEAAADEGELIRCPRCIHWWPGGSLGFGGAPAPALPAHAEPVVWVEGIAGDGLASVSVGSRDRRRERAVTPGTPFVVIVPEADDDPVEVTLGLASGASVLEVL